MKVDESQLVCLSEKARVNEGIKGTLLLKSGEPRIHRWHRRYCCVYRNMLFYFESEGSAKPSGVIFLEHCTCLVVPTADEKVSCKARLHAAPAIYTFAHSNILSLLASKDWVTSTFCSLQQHHLNAERGWTR